MTKGGYKRKEESWSYVLTNADLIRIAKTTDLKTYVKQQQLNYMRKVVNKDNTSIVKQLIFNSDKSKKTGPKNTLLVSVLKNEECQPEEFFKRLKNMQL